MGVLHPSRAAVLALVAGMVLLGCGRPSPRVPSPDAPGALPGATIVNGTERLAWSQPGDAASLRFRAYVDGSPVDVDASCNQERPEAACSAPLPPMSNGVHTIELVAVSASGESEASGPITVQKVSARSVVSAASFPDARFSAGEARDAVVTTSAGHAFTADVVARELKGPLQLASTPDGRLLIAESDGRVRVVRPGQLDGPAVALDGPALLSPPPLGSSGLALHPDFERNQFVYLSFLAEDGPDQMLLRIIRLREVGNTLGEPASLFESRVTRTSSAPVNAAVAGEPGATDQSPEEGPRMAFGPDGLLYTLLPQGFEFDNVAAASRPHPSLLRIEDDGGVPASGALSGIVAHPLGFTWHPSTAGLWLIVPDQNGDASAGPVTAGSLAAPDRSGPALLRMDRSGSSGALSFQEAGVLTLASALAQPFELESLGTLRLTVPILAETVIQGISGRVIDVTPGGGGTLYLATRGVEDASADGGRGADVVVRLRPAAAK